MIYLIGGPSRCGKSTLRKNLLTNHKISGVCVDQILHMLKYGLRNFDLEHKSPVQERAEKLKPFIKGLCKYHPEDDFVIEGVGILPQDIVEYSESVGGMVSACFLGSIQTTIEEKISAIQNSNPYNHWTRNFTNEEMNVLVRRIIETSMWYSKECEKYGLPFIDTSTDFEKRIIYAAQKLKQKTNNV
jgi:hypothetical protein